MNQSRIQGTANFTSTIHPGVPKVTDHTNNVTVSTISVLTAEGRRIARTRSALPGHLGDPVRNSDNFLGDVLR
jgi:hypothetical protein